ELADALRAAGRDAVQDLAGFEIDDLHRAVAVADPTLIAGGEKAVGAGGLARLADADQPADAADIAVAARVDDIHRLVVLVGEIGAPRLLVEIDGAEGGDRRAGDIDLADLGEARRRGAEWPQRQHEAKQQRMPECHLILPEPFIGPVRPASGDVSADPADLEPRCGSRSAGEAARLPGKAELSPNGLGRIPVTR